MNIIAKGALAVAKWAGYNAAMPNKTQAQATRIGTSPNSQYTQMQRIRLSLEGENAVKNTPFAINYVYKRRMYCSGGISWSPDTGDAMRDEDIAAVLNEEWSRMGIECSMQEAFSRVADVHLPSAGDSALMLYRDQDRLRLIEITADRIGEQYAYNSPREIDGKMYISGVFWSGCNVDSYKIYDHYSDGVYANPRIVPARDIIFFKDDIMGGVRGVSKFAACLEDVNSRYQILKATKDTMLQQSKVAAIARNNSGAPSDYDYQTVERSDGTIDYVESFADGAVLKYQFNGDSYQVLKAEHPSDAFLKGLKYVDAQAALGSGFPYEFLFTAADSGGAPSRLAIEIASREITRIRERVHRPRLNRIAYITIMDLVRRKKLPAIPTIQRGTWQFGTLPTADAFRDSKSDIADIRAGIKTRGEVISANSGQTFPVILRRTTQEAIAIAKAVQDANAELEASGYEPTVTAADIALNTDNPPAVQNNLQEPQDDAKDAAE